MESTAEKTSVLDGDRCWRREASAILVLLLLTGAIHIWLMRHTEVLARDGVGFIHYAWRLRHEPWDEVLRTSLQHPGYPLAIAVVSKILPVPNGSLCDQMILSAQLVNLMAGCLLAIAMFYLGKELFNRRVGFWTAALFQCLPGAARVTSDALSEATFLLTVTVTLLFAVRSLRDYSIWRLGLCGACGGICFLIRPEGGLTVLAVAAVLIGLQALRGWRRPWRQVLAAVGSLALAATLVAGPYVAILGQLSNKPTSQKVLDLAGTNIEDEGSRIEDRGSKIGYSFDPRSSSILDLQCLLWAVSWHADWNGSWLEGLAWTVWAVAQKLIRGFGYIAWLPAVLGLYWCRGQWRKQPEILILGLLCLFQVLVLCRVGLVVGYVSERHVLIIALGGLYWAVWAVLSFPQQLGRIARSRSDDRCNAECGMRNVELKKKDIQPLFLYSALRIPHSASWLPVGILLAFMLACLPVTLQPLHANQVGHREAGFWLAEHTQPGDIIVDPFDWAYFYSGHAFQNATPSLILPSDLPKRYVVLETLRKPHPELIMLPQAEQLAAGAPVVYDWQPNRHQLKHRAQEVQIFAVPIPSQ